MVNRSDSTDAAAADPWLRAALQRPAGPPAEEPGEKTPVSSIASSTSPSPSPTADADARAVGASIPAADPEAGSPEASVAPPSEEPGGARTDPRAVRRLAVQALYVLDAEPDIPHPALLEALDEPFDDEDEPDAHADLPAAAKVAAVDLAVAAWAGHEAADVAIVARVPAWPTSRQPPVDRAILRLAHHELATKRAPFAVVIDEAVELAHAFGEERTAGFVNAVLDGLARGHAVSDPAGGDVGEVRRARGDRPAAGAAEARRGQRRRFNVRKAEMAAKIGPKRPRRGPEDAADPPEAPAVDGLPGQVLPPVAEPEASGGPSVGEASVAPDPVPVPAPDPAPTSRTDGPAPDRPAEPEAPADPWAAAAARRGEPG